MDASTVLPLYCRPGFMNPSVVGPSSVELSAAPVDPMEVALPAARRVVDAYHRALREEQMPAPSLWDHAARQHTAFLEALAHGDLETVAGALAGFFAGPLTWGLAPVLPPDAPEHAFVGMVVRTADSLVSLAQAVGVLPVRSIEQGGPLHTQLVPPESIGGLVDTVEQETGLDLSFLNAAGNRGWRFGSRVTNMDTLRHTYAVWRLRQLRLASAEKLIEIGGGFGCMAALAVRAGYRNYTILDLPWVNALQGYILIRTLGHEAVQLYGESSRGAVKVAPFWTISTLPDRSVDAVINVNSLPEIGYESARRYVQRIGAIIRRVFLSINQEGQALTVQGTKQLRVWELVRQEPRLELRSRQIAWMEQGYVEEIYTPAGSGALF
jgi:hypothetical protein